MVRLWRKTKEKLIITPLTPLTLRGGYSPLRKGGARGGYEIKAHQNKLPSYLSLAESAQLAGMSRKYLNVLVYRKRIRVEMADGQWFTTREWLNDYLRSVHRPEILEEAVRTLQGIGASPSGLNSGVEQGLMALAEKIGGLADQIGRGQADMNRNNAPHPPLNVRGGEGKLSSSDKFADAYIRQTEFLQEQFGKMLDRQDQGVAIARTPSAIEGDTAVPTQDEIAAASGLAMSEMQSRIDELSEELSAEQADKQALLF